MIYVKNFFKKHLYLLLVPIGILLPMRTEIVSVGSGTANNTTLPSIGITLDNVSLQEIHNESKDIRYMDNEVLICDPQDGTWYTISGVEIKGRGNSSWKMPKKSYQLRFDDKVSLLGMEPAKAWLLIANYADASLMRNKLMYDLAGELMDYAPDSCHVDLWMHDEYLGNYLLCEKIEVHDSRVALKHEKGLLVEADNIYFYEAEERFRSPVSNSYFVLKDSKANDLEKEDSAAREAFQEFETYIYEFESLLYAEEKEWSAIRELIDVESFVIYYFLEELAQNSDSCRTSIYMYKDGPEDQLHMGPVWDFDKAVGYSQRQKYGGDPEIDYVANIQDHMGNTKELTWYMELFEIPEFQDEAERIYAEQIAPVLALTEKYIDSYQLEIQESAQMNYQKWNIADIPIECDHEPYAHTSWEESVQALKRWTEDRIRYLNLTYM